MTISECIIEWLGEYQKMEFAECAVDQIEAEDGTYAIFKTPNKNVTEYMDGSQLVTEYFQLVARKSTQLNPERVNNQQMLVDLENWVEEKNMEEDYPDLSKAGKLICMDIDVSDSNSIVSQEDASAIYQLSIAIQYLKERGGCEANE